MWWHFVEALEVSISVNVWSQAVQADVMEQVRVFFLRRFDSQEDTYELCDMLPD